MNQELKRCLSQIEISSGMGIVYVIENRLGRVKIGITANPDKRISSLEWNSGLDVIRFRFSPPCVNYREIETELHRFFRDKRIGGEWFDVSFVDVNKKLLEMEFYAKRPEPKDIKDMSINEILAYRVKQLRESKNLSQAALAECAGVMQSMISDVENQKRMPKGVILSKLARALGVSIDYLLGSEEKTA